MRIKEARGFTVRLGATGVDEIAFGSKGIEVEITGGDRKGSTVDVSGGGDDKGSKVAVSGGGDDNKGLKVAGSGRVTFSFVFRFGGTRALTKDLKRLPATVLFLGGFIKRCMVFRLTVIPRVFLM